ncbi:MAG: Regulator of chromosome condensation (RCC1) repeat protein [Methanocella sp. PtaU1.Bin125]|nr:MAG: Regulator of chromosome condensation (RCC1) repeat protein [Methanocella sp. PtaU1.Bin125]
MNVHKKFLYAIGFSLILVMLISQCASALKVVAVDSRMFLSVALCDDGKVMAWGEGGGYASSTPVFLNISDVKSVSVSNGDIFFLKTDGTVWATGGNYYGELGIGTEETTMGIVQVIGLDNIVAISAGTDHVLALKGDGTVWAWGNNRYGEIGNGNVSHSQPYPVMVDGLANITCISAGYRVSMAVTRDGTLWAWGTNDNGELGDGTNVHKSRPVRVDITDVKYVYAGQMGEIIAVKNDGTVWAWGANFFGQRGNGEYGKDLYTPTIVNGISCVTEATVSVTASLAVTDDGMVWIWGENQGGIFGNGKLYGSSSTRPVQVSGLNNITHVAQGWSHAVALSDDGTVWAWGDNVKNQVGNGAAVKNVLTPIMIISGNSPKDGVPANNTLVQSNPTYSPDMTPSTMPQQNTGKNVMWLIGIMGIALVVLLAVFINKIRKS